MTAVDELRAFDELASHPHLSDLTAIARQAFLLDAPAETALSTAEKIQQALSTLPFSRDRAAVSSVNAIDILGRGPQNDSERAVASALLAHAIAESKEARDERSASVLASRVIHLATHTAFDATRLLDRALGAETDAAVAMWNAIADNARDLFSDSALQGSKRAEALMACAALAGSSSSIAQRRIQEVARYSKDSALSKWLAAEAPAKEPQLPDFHMTGELDTPPRSPLATTALAITGILFVIQLGRLAARLVLSYKRPTEVTVSGDSVHIRSRTELFGRTLRDKDLIIARAGLAKAAREERFPRAALYAGLAALAIGSYIGAGTLVDGVRSASPSLLFVGTALIVVGIGLDFVLGSVAPGIAGRCRVVFVPHQGRAVCISGVDRLGADSALSRLIR